MAENAPKKKITVSEKKPGNNSSKKSAKPASKKAVPMKIRPRNVKNDRKIHQFMPFLWFALAIFLAVCFIPYDFGLKGDRNIMGIFGEIMHMIPFGLFGLAAYLLIPLCVYYGVRWRRLVGADTKSRTSKEYEPRLLVKTVYCGVIILLTSILCHVISMAAGGFDGVGIAEFWNNGNMLSGGGVIGGLIGWCFFKLLSAVGSIIVIAVVIIIIVLLFADITPHTIAVAMKARRKLRAEQRELAAAEAAKYAAYESDEEDEEPEEPEEQDSTGNAPAKKSKLITIKRREKPEPKPAADDEFFDDGFFDIHPEKGAVIIDEKEEEQKPEVVSEPEPVAETQVPAEPAPEAVKQPEKVNLSDIFKGTMADDDEDDGNPDNAAVLALTTDSEQVKETEPISDPGKRPWTPPPVDLLVQDTAVKAEFTDAITAMKRKLYETLAEYDIRVKDIGCSIGPSITRYEVYPEAGVRVRAIANLTEDIQMRISSGNIRIAPIDNKPAIGIEVANAVRTTVHMRTLIDTDTFRNSAPLTSCLGQDVAGKNIYFDIKKMPHIIIAGTTGSGKSVCINGIICSLLYKNSPDKVKLILIDPKKVEFSVYKQIPHLLCPVITEATKAAGALASAVAEMERRYTLIEDVGVRDVDSYNTVTAKDPERKYLPKIVIIIDELADLMMMAKTDVEQFITRIAQKARAVGIHLVIGTQRPSVDVITGLIKANVPSRIACTVKSQVDSRTILDYAGAEKLIGQGDMLFAPIGLPKPLRVQGAFLTDEEVMSVVDFIRDNNEPGEFDEEFVKNMDIAAESIGEKKAGNGSLDMSEMSGGDGEDAIFNQAVKVALTEGKVSTSLLQRKLQVGYGRAAKLIDRMEEKGYVSEPDGNKPRRILITKQEFYEKLVNGDSGSSSSDAE